MRRITSAAPFLAAGAMLLASLGPSAFGQKSSPLFPVALQVPVAPTAFKANGKMNVVYELHATNFRAGDLRLSRVEVHDDASATPIASYRDTELDGLLSRPGTGGAATDVRLIGAGMRVVVYLWLTFDTPASVPPRLHHRLYFTIPSSSEGVERVVDGAPVLVRTDGPIAIGPPVHGQGWVARFNGPTSFHRRGLMIVNGRAGISQRFATDWGKYGDDWKVLRTGDGSKNSDFYIYGEELIAVADATVVDVRDDLPENDPSSSTPAVPVAFETAAGNHVVLDLGHGHYALYAHMQPKMTRVKVGDHVKRGQVLGLVGNSGNAVGPHLHFQIADSPVPLDGEGLPFVVDSFELLGVESKQAFQDGVWQPDPGFKPEHRHKEMPSENMIVRFP